MRISDWSSDVCSSDLGCRGSLTKGLFEKFNLRDGVDPQTYGLGVKELWEVAPEQHKPGLVIHSQGWPLDSKKAGGGFIRSEERRVGNAGCRKCMSLWWASNTTKKPHYNNIQTN